MTSAYQYMQQGDIIELYKFDIPSIAGFTPFYLTTDYQDYIYGGVTWIASAVTRSKITNKTNCDPGQCTISFPVTESVTCLADDPYTAFRIQVTITRYYSTLTQNETTFIGFIQSAIIENGMVTFNCVSILGDTTRNIPRVRFQSLCNNVLGDAVCGVTLASFTTNITLSGVSGAILTSSDLDTQPGMGGSPRDGYWTWGRAVYYYTDAFGNVIPVSRFITKHAAHVIYLHYPITYLSIGSVVSVYAGCNKTPTQVSPTNGLICTNCCKGIPFSNFGTPDGAGKFVGFQYIPDKNPQDTPITLT